MKLIISDSFEEMSETAAEDFIFNVEKIAQPLICLPSGKTPVLFCRFIREYFLEKAAPPDWYFVGLDEWQGIGADEEGGCRHFFDTQLFKPLGIPENRICFFDGLTTEPEKEGRKVEAFIDNRGEVDLMVLGLGTNGHLGFNEPGSDISLRTQLATLEPSTLDAGRNYFPFSRELQKGFTLGLATVMASKTVFLIANGSHKAEIVRKVVEKPVTPTVPGSLLQRHPNCYVYLDAAAASLLT